MSQIHEKALDKFGMTAQMLKLAEECNELAAAILRSIAEDGSLDDVAEEVADVRFCIKYAEMLFGVDVIDAIEAKKAERLEARLKA